MIIKAATLWVPWAYLIPPPGPKSLETRGWDTKYRGPLLICAGQKVMSWDFLFELGKQEVWRKAVAPIFGREPKDYYEFAQWIRQHLKYGVAVATCNLVDTYRTETLKGGTMLYNNLPFGDFSSGRFAWHLKNRKAIKPFRVWGRQSLFDVEIPEGLI